ncbi:MAG TPA: hypothetical protein VMG99_05700 [Thermoplasmata archaeon]|jgi:hypothetical protein|nr:hypothetical protein [Thermoplasmata archaeon]
MNALVPRPLTELPALTRTNFARSPVESGRPALLPRAGARAPRAADRRTRRLWSEFLAPL